MSETQREEFYNCGHDLLVALTVCNERAQKGKANESKKLAHEARLVEVVDQLRETVATGNHLNNIYKNIQSYAIKHKEKSKNILDLAILEAGELVPDADVEGIHLKYTPDGRVIVVTGDDQSVVVREGGAYSSILGALIRYAALKAQPDALQLMLYDEQFFTLSDTTTGCMKPIFEAMKKDITIICIEQRRNIMDGICDIEYQFKKGRNKASTVTRVL